MQCSTEYNGFLKATKTLNAKQLQSKGLQPIPKSNARHWSLRDGTNSRRTKVD